MILWERIKKKIRRALEKMARENEQAFGRKRMDCCQLNKSGKQPKNHSEKNRKAASANTFSSLD